MCSQPPKTHDDSRLLQQAFQLLDLLPADTTDIICTGGEPTWYGDAFIDLLTRTYERLPVSGVHILSNGRRFSDGDYAARYAMGGNPNMMIGIPVYGPEPALHDHVVQASGAFNETIFGILNLAALNQRIELRTVIHRQTACTAPKLVAYCLTCGFAESLTQLCSTR